MLLSDSLRMPTCNEVLRDSLSKFPRRTGMSLPQVTVACPHCGSTGTYQLGGTQSGTTPVYCNSCRTGFRIEYKNSQVVRTLKS